MQTDKQDLILAIERTQRELDVLKAGVFASGSRTIEIQAMSAEAYAAYAQRIIEVTGELRFEALRIAAELGNQGPIHPLTARDIRGCEEGDEILSEVRDWIDEVRLEQVA